MALVTKDFSINITPGEMPPIIHVSEYDIGRAFNVTLIGENRNAFEIPTGTTATVEGTLNGTVGFTTSATISNNQITFALTESMTAYAGRAWCKIKLTLNSEPIQTCAFILAVDRAGVEADTVIGADGFEQQIVDAVQDWLDEHPPASGGMTEAFKQALLDCFENVAWINDDGQTYYDALYAALYPPADVLSISAVFTQGSAVIYDTDSLDDLKQYLVVTATMTDSTTRTLEDTDYTLSGTLAVGTSTITVSYGGQTATFSVTVTDSILPSGYTRIAAIHGNGGSKTVTSIGVPLGYKVKSRGRIASQPSASACLVGGTRTTTTSTTANLAYFMFSTTANKVGAFYGSSNCFVENSGIYGSFVEVEATITKQTVSVVLTVDGSEYPLSITNVSGNNSTDTDAINLFTTGYSSSVPPVADLDYVEIYNANNELVEALYACQRDIDGVVGMYAITQDHFYTSDTTTPYTAVNL